MTWAQFKQQIAMLDRIQGKGVMVSAIQALSHSSSNNNRVDQCHAHAKIVREADGSRNRDIGRAMSQLLRYVLTRDTHALMRTRIRLTRQIVHQYRFMCSSNGKPSTLSTHRGTQSSTRSTQISSMSVLFGGRFRQMLSPDVGGVSV